MARIVNFNSSKTAVLNAIESQSHTVGSIFWGLGATERLRLRLGGWHSRVYPIRIGDASSGAPFWFVAAVLGRFSGQAPGAERELHDGRHRDGCVFGVFHAESVVSGASAP